MILLNTEQIEAIKKNTPNKLSRLDAAVSSSVVLPLTVQKLFAKRCGSKMRAPKINATGF